MIKAKTLFSELFLEWDSGIEITDRDIAKSSMNVSMLRVTT